MCPWIYNSFQCVRFTGAPLLPACLIIDEADDHFSGSKSEHILLDIVQVIRPRHSCDSPDVSIDPSEVLNHNSKAIPSGGIASSIPNEQRNSDAVKLPYENPRMSSGSVRVVESIPRLEVSPIQLIFSGASLSDGRANTVGQRILQR